MMICSVGTLHQMDFGAHIHDLDEWNEECTWEWDYAYVQYDFPFTTVVHPHRCNGIEATAVAVYRTYGEGDIRSLRIYDRHGKSSDYNLHARKTPEETWK